MVTKCPNCAATLTGDETLCPNCGHEIASAWPPPLAEELPDMPKFPPQRDTQAYNAGGLASLGLVFLSLYLASVTGKWLVICVGPIIAFLCAAYQWNRYRDLARGLIMGVVIFYGGVAVLWLGLLAICSWGTYR
ncbi:MAG TPA: zinc ribbon domain-containing protein [Capsulimonadaceae bacterium]|jgi:hypothetical protein